MRQIMQAHSVMRDSERAIAVLLSHRYGDGVVYLSRGNERPIFECAVNRGFIGHDGFVTRKGRNLLARTSKVLTSVGE